MMNLRSALENNDLLKRDLGPFKEESNEWGSYTLVFSKLNARITVASSEQSIRGLRHNQNRPDLVIGDDVEDIDSVKTRESRNKTYEWWTSEVIPIGQKNTRFVIIGNLLHDDSLLMRIKEDIKDNKIDGIFKEYPLVSSGIILWPGKYSSMDDIEKEKRKSNNEFAWQREYMLQIIPDEEQAIQRGWIQYYTEIPTGQNDFQGYPLNTEVWIGIDPAVSLKSTADYTAMVPALLLGEGKETKIYILPKIINRRMTFPEIVDTCKILNKTYYEVRKRFPTLVIEDVGSQKALPQQLANEYIHNVRTFNPGNQDKRTRLILTAYMIKNGKILFPQEGAEELINQIVHFGTEKHDDLVDAFSSLVLSVVEKPPIVPRLIRI
jgi:predicted phage terminase large subunit-like protein